MARRYFIANDCQLQLGSIMKRFAILLFLCALPAAAAAAAAAEPTTTVHLVLQGHRFAPEKTTVPAGQRVSIELVNKDAAAEEFDSDDLHVERDVTPHGKVAFEIGPLAPGAYGFMGELHPDTASGEIVAVAASAAAR
jgi:plastocyanin